MKKEFVPFELAVKLKQLGFDEPCFGIWKDGKLISVGGHWGAGITHSMFGFEGDRFAPDEYRASTFSQAFRWFREEYKIDYHVDRGFKDEYYYTILENGKNHPISGFYNNSYEKAEIACLNKLIEILNKQQEQ
jgi:hypothetical protein